MEHDANDRAVVVATEWLRNSHYCLSSSPGKAFASKVGSNETFTSITRSPSMAPPLVSGFVALRRRRSGAVRRGTRGAH